MSHSSTVPLQIAVAGAGLIGQRHIAMIAANPDCAVSAIVDVSDKAQATAAALGVPIFKSLPDCFAASKPDGIILATPNHLHVEQALACIDAGVPVLIEKPVAHTLAAGLQLQAAADHANARIMVGHHRQHGSIMSKAVEVIQSGALGKIVAVVGTALFYKPDAAGYFSGANAWRREPGGGPVLINMIHEVGNLRALAGDIIEVQAYTSNATRGFDVEDTAVVNVRFSSGALGTFALSDTAATDRSWEHTSGEDKVNYAAAHSDVDDCYLVTGTRGSLAIPTMRLQRYPSDEDRSWHKPLLKSTVQTTVIDPLAAQIAQFCEVITGKAAPRVTVRDGVQNLRVIDAIVTSARTGRSVSIAS